GSVEIISLPEGAEIYTFDGELVGMTPHSIPRIKTGPVSYEIRLEGFKPHYFENRAVVVDGLLELKAELEAGQAVAYGKKWVNSIGMEFEPVGEQLLVSKFETRRREFEEFIDNNDEYAMPNHGHSSQGVHPVDAVSRVDAEAFCTWLTEYERANNYITIRHVYRLPTDEEWSQLAGLPKEPGATPENRNNKIDGIFPWGYEWPPPPYSGNFSDESRASLYEDQLGIVSSNVPAPPIIVGYDDGVPEIGWAREHNENRYKLHQVSGNVWEWVSTNFTAGSSTKMGVIRGGSWETAERTELLSSHRRSLVSTAREPGVGFRVVLTRVRNGN
ncbi:MAG: SUMF1/EgtB/PvdO family nonheme iron enzyme, partial [Verrucomicrobiota bacterium]